MKEFLKNLIGEMKKDPTSKGFYYQPEGFITLDDDFFNEEEDGLNVHQFSHKESPIELFPIGR